MNTLAHLYLSGDDPDLLLGNFIGDSVRGDDFLQLEYRVQQGVLLHRSIDRFTDQHAVFKHICSMMRDGFSRYAPVVADVFLDHFLARDWERFNTQPLKEYVQWAQGLLASRIDRCPERSRRYFHYLRYNEYACAVSVNRRDLQYTFANVQTNAFQVRNGKCGTGINELL